MDDRDAPFAIVIDIRPDPPMTPLASWIQAAGLHGILVAMSCVLGLSIMGIYQEALHMLGLLLLLVIMTMIHESLTRKQRRSP